MGFISIVREEYKAFCRIVTAHGFTHPSDFAVQARELDGDTLLELIENYCDEIEEKLNIEKGIGKVFYFSELLRRPSNTWCAEFWRHLLHDNLVAMLVFGSQHETISFIERKWQENNCYTDSEIQYKKEILDTRPMLYRAGFIDGYYWTTDKATAYGYYRYRCERAGVSVFDRKITGKFNLWMAPFPQNDENIVGVRLFAEPDQDRFPGIDIVREVLVDPRDIAKTATPLRASLFKPSLTPRRPFSFRFAFYRWTAGEIMSTCIILAMAFGWIFVYARWYFFHSA